MDYSIDVRKSYIYVKINGHISLINPSEWVKIKSALANVVDNIRKASIYKLLVDCRELSARLSTIDRFLLATFFVDENSKLIAGKLPLLKITFVVNQFLIDPGKFGEIVARNRGLDRLVTENMPEALQWLEKDTP